MKENATLEKIKAAFETWWCDEGSRMQPNPAEDTEAFAHRMTKIAWLGGALNAAELTKDL